jgi:hypothetical protein
MTDNPSQIRCSPPHLKNPMNNDEDPCDTTKLEENDLKVKKKTKKTASCLSAVRYFKILKNTVEF